MGLKVNGPTIRAGGRGEAENDMARLTALMEELQLEAAVGPGVKGTWEDGWRWMKMSRKYHPKMQVFGNSERRWEDPFTPKCYLKSIISWCDVGWQSLMFKICQNMFEILKKSRFSTCADGIHFDYRGQGRDPAAVLPWTTGSRRKHGGSTKRISCVWLMMLQCDFITSYKLYYTIESDLQWVQWALDVALCRNPLIQQHRWSSAVFRWKPVGHSFILLFHFELDGTDAQHFKKTTWSWSILSKPTS